MKSLRINLWCTVVMSSLIMSGQETIAQQNVGLSREVVLENVVTLERSFGLDSLPDEYRLVGNRFGPPLSQTGIIMDSQNRIYVFDDNRIKVFNVDGTPAAIIGREGEGPGEFSDIVSYRSLISVSHTGFISAYNFMLDDSSKKMHNEYHIFRPDFSYLTTVYTPAHETISESMNPVIALSEDEFIREKTMQRREDGYKKVKFTLEHVNIAGSSVIASYDIITDVATERSEMSVPFRGSFLWDVTPGKKVVYTYTYADEEYTESGFFYFIHITDLRTGETTSIRREFTPVPMLIIDPSGFSGFEKEMDLLSIKWEEYINEINHFYRSAVFSLFVDGSTLIVFTNELLKLPVERSVLTKADIFDLETGKYLRSAMLPRVLADIKNGYGVSGYYIKPRERSFFDILKNIILRRPLDFKISRDGYSLPPSGPPNRLPLVQVYKLDPAIYER